MSFSVVQVDIKRQVACSLEWSVQIVINASEASDSIQYSSLVCSPLVWLQVCAYNFWVWEVEMLQNRWPFRSTQIPSSHRVLHQNLSVLSRLLISASPVNRAAGPQPCWIQKMHLRKLRQDGYKFQGKFPFSILCQSLDHTNCSTWSCHMWFSMILWLSLGLIFCRKAQTDLCNSQWLDTHNIHHSILVGNFMQGSYLVELPRDLKRRGLLPSSILAREQINSPWSVLHHNMRCYDYLHIIVCSVFLHSVLVVSSLSQGWASLNMPRETLPLQHVHSLYVWQKGSLVLEGLTLFSLGSGNGPYRHHSQILITLPARIIDCVPYCHSYHTSTITGKIDRPATATSKRVCLLCLQPSMQRSRLYVSTILIIPGRCTIQACLRLVNKLK